MKRLSARAGVVKSRVNNAAASQIGRFMARSFLLCVPDGFVRCCPPSDCKL
jgi:hypothetical protein